MIFSYLSKSLDSYLGTWICTWEPLHTGMVYIWPILRNSDLYLGTWTCTWKLWPWPVLVYVVRVPEVVCHCQGVIRFQYWLKKIDGSLLENDIPVLVRVITHHSWGTGFIINPMLALLQIAFIRVYVLTVIMALVVVKKLLWLDMHNGSRQLKEVISDLTPCCK